MNAKIQRESSLDRFCLNFSKASKFVWNSYEAIPRFFRARSYHKDTPVIYLFFFKETLCKDGRIKSAYGFFSIVRRHRE